MLYKMIDSDIVSGMKCSASFCPLARMFKRYHPSKNITVGFSSFGDSHMFETTTEMKKFILLYDGDNSVSPQTFSIPFKVE